jgi:hypothetical protein
MVTSPYIQSSYFVKAFRLLCNPLNTTQGVLIGTGKVHWQAAGLTHLLNQGGFANLAWAGNHLSEAARIF